MIKKTITYENFNGVPTSESFYFHMSQAELLRLEVSTKGGLQKALETMVAAEDGAAIMEFMETFIKGSVGKKSEDGSRFDKSPETLADFLSSPAYDTLFMELITDPAKAAEFLNGIVPAEMAANVERLSKLEQVKANVAKRQGTGDDALMIDETPDEPYDPERATISDPSQGGNVFKPNVRTLTRAELLDMDHNELTSGLAEGRYKLTE